MSWIALLGLCTADGGIVTEPLYFNIYPVGKDLYLCSYHDSHASILVNSKGETVKQSNT